MPFEPRFGHAADEFQRYRPDYPQALYDRIFAAVPEQDRRRAMDLGAGTGIVTAHLVPYFQQVIAVEPDAAMAAKIVEQFPQVTTRNVIAEECRQPAGTVDLVTIANALHWMDAERVLASVRCWLRADGVLAVFDRPLPKAGAEIDAITLEQLRGPWKPHRDPLLKRDLNWEGRVRAAPGFALLEEQKSPYVVSMSPKDYVGFWRSTSYGSAYARTLADPEHYWSDLESRFAGVVGGSIISVDFSPTLILTRKIWRTARGIRAGQIDQSQRRERKMTRRSTIFLAAIATCFAALGIHAESGRSDSWKRADVETTASFRGLSVLSTAVVWASGTRGTVIRTVDGGRTWSVRLVAGAQNQDFRGIRAFDAENAVIMSTGNAEKGLATIYRTSDGGKTWVLAFAPKTTGVFFDSIAFWDRERGVVLSDPVDGHFVMFRTADGGATWTQIPPGKFPAALKGEGSFAASNSCIAVQGEKNVWFVTGGASVARVLRSNDGGQTWNVAETPVRPPNASSGLFSIAFRDARYGVAVGGDYANPGSSPKPTIIRTTDGGQTWEAISGPAQPRSLFFSSIAFIPSSQAQSSRSPGMWVVGPVGAFMKPAGKPWVSEGTENLNDVAMAGEHTAWTVGPKGFVARLHW